MAKSVQEWLEKIFPPKSVVTHTLTNKDERLFVEKKNSCPACHARLDQEKLQISLYVCPHCGHHFRLTPWERINYTADGGVFHEFDTDIKSLNPLDFPDYDKKLATSMESSKLNEAVVTGVCQIGGHEAVLAVMAFKFMGGSMGSVVGEKISRAIELGMEKRIPVIIFCTSGGARMQEGIFSLMQMAKTAGSIAMIEEERVPLFVVLTDPTTGGVTASYAMLGDVTIAEPGAHIGFAGARVIEGTIRQKFIETRYSEFQLEKGFVDAIVPRQDLRKTLIFLIEAHLSACKGDMG